MTHAAAQVLDAETLALLNQCRSCKATCCTYITVDLTDPGDDIEEYESIRWYLTRPNTIVFVDDGDWYLQIGEKCQFLQPDWSCGIYDKRPKTCADHDPKGCEYWGDPEDDYDMVWHSFEAFDEWYQTKIKPRLVREAEKAAKARSARARKAAKARWANRPKKPGALTP